MKMQDLVVVPRVFDYESRQVRFFEIEGVRSAVATDICKILDLKNPTRALSVISDDDKLTISRSDTLTSTKGIWSQLPPQVQDITLITENGVMELVMQSRKPKAIAFRRWLLREVWPAIRDTGTYSIHPQLPQTHAEALRALADEVEARELAEAKVAELKPKADFYDNVIKIKGAYSYAAAATEVGWTRNKMMKELRDQKVIKSGPSDCRNLPYAQYLHHFKVVPAKWTNPKTGEDVPTRVAHVRRESIPWLRRRLLKGS